MILKEYIWTVLVTAGIVVLSLIGLCLFGIIDMVEARVCRWQK